MTKEAKLNKGAGLEEVLRAYFLRSGFFVIRGVPFRLAEEDLTDVDLWLYERPTGTARRVQVCDIKYKQRPRAVERIFWTRGVAEALDADGAYVATTDRRIGLRPLAEKLNVQLIDGNDISRIQNSPNVVFRDRITDEILIQELTEADRDSRSKELRDSRLDILASLSDGFGPPSVVRSLGGFTRLATTSVTYHPDSKAAKAAGRLTFLAAAITCESLDYISVRAAFRSLDEKRDLMLDTVRLGALSGSQGRQTLNLAKGLVAKYAPGGNAAAAALEAGLKKDLENIPAEIIADQAVNLLKDNQLFHTGREFEAAAYHTHLPSFDELSLPTKSMLGALLDYSGVEREKFANAWKPSKVTKTGFPDPSAKLSADRPSLFDGKD